MLKADESGRLRRRFPLCFLAATVFFAVAASNLTCLLIVTLAPAIHRRWLTVIGMAAGLLASMLWVDLHTRLHRRQFRQAIRRHGYDLCPRCGYWLKGLPANATRCPECGAERTTVAAKAT